MEIQFSAVGDSVGMARCIFVIAVLDIKFTLTCIIRAVFHSKQLVLSLPPTAAAQGSLLDLHDQLDTALHLPPEDCRAIKCHLLIALQA